MKRYPLIFVLLGMITALALAIVYIIWELNPPMNDIRLLMLFMSGSGAFTLLTTYILYRIGLVRLFPGLRWALLSIVMLTVVLIFANVWVTAKLMFISEHDLVLTTALLVFAGLTALTFGLFIADTLSARIQVLSSAAEHLAQGKLDTRLTVQGKDELADLAKTFNWMASNLEKIDLEKQMIEQTRRDLMAWVSHDLRTPLTSIRVMIEALADGVVSDPDTTQRYIHSSLAELQHLGRLIDDLFELAKLDAGHLDAHYDLSSLKDLISDVLSRMNVQATHKQVRLNGYVNSDIDVVYMAPDKIQRVLYNLIDNALRYTPPEGEITIRACRETKHIRIDVHNTGSAIDSDHLPYIFNSFYRGESSRVREDDGHRSAGLGLAIARGFVEAHRGKIWVESQNGQGTTFSFTLPVINS